MNNMNNTSRMNNRNEASVRNIDYTQCDKALRDGYNIWKEILEGHSKKLDAGVIVGNIKNPNLIQEPKVKADIAQQLGSILDAEIIKNQRQHDFDAFDCYNALSKEQLTPESSVNKPQGIAPSATKESPQGIKYDKAKAMYSLIPPRALHEVARNLTAGADKYPLDNWKKVQGARRRYYDALQRHLYAHNIGEIYDKESTQENILHLSAVVVNAMFLLEFMLDPDLADKGFDKLD